MKDLIAIAKYTVIEQIRNRLYLIMLFFGGVILAASILLGALAPGQKVRVIFDLGLVTLELFGLATAVFGAVTLILQEIESKTIYLLLTRPLNRMVYILGRFVGLMVAVTITIMVMAVFLLLVMMVDRHEFIDFVWGWSFWATYPTLILMSLCKMLITSAIAIFFSLFATSSVSALVFTAFFWIAGHFGPEMAFLIKQQVPGVASLLVRGVVAILPNFQYLNFRDTFAISGFQGYDFMGWALLYTLGYTLVFLALASFLFSKKEF